MSPFIVSLVDEQSAPGFTEREMCSFSKLGVTDRPGSHVDLLLQKSPLIIEVTITTNELAWTERGSI